MFDPIDFGDFEKRTGIRKRDFPVTGWKRAGRIFALRDLAKVLDIRAMSKEYLFRLLLSVTLTGDGKTKVYKDGRIKLLRADPHGLLIGQTFLLRSKYQGILENFPRVFGSFCEVRGMAKLPARIVLGESAEGEQVIAHYVPPILEGNSVSHEPLLLDGIHRNFLAMSVGTTLEAIVVHGVSAPFPARPMEWGSISVMNEKPPKEERFFDLKPELFRDLKSIGIDG
ncbi:hypothetical protein A3A38_02130 [Candidatus Kaiserbacteria bacterium RIFCSPLOWO2_01_FULL_53_17]|uniref:Uncharacterized protein n=1 Tax=Candidatus Kaiserbacteria bacterium RIFCSPLOWO2_01_FULL_53_17 TaxID=1798511 RepID=A0A1F6EFN2_9BACT|nr:MAG: hypothetical protein A3A38_02130 [Candidatus Kaiserbacteria bacterium RIFCSPLOWO2_01_FULL_53_17]